MAKKKATKKTKSPRPHYFVRCSEEESEMFERASELEGHKSVQEWILRIGRLRARAVLAAEEDGTLDKLS